MVLSRSSMMARRTGPMMLGDLHRWMQVIGMMAGCNTKHPTRWRFPTRASMSKASVWLRHAQFIAGATGYDAAAAQAAAAARARRPKTPKLAADAGLAGSVSALLAHRMSPHAICALLRCEGTSIAAETIYRACYDHSGRQGPARGVLEAAAETLPTAQTPGPSRTKAQPAGRFPAHAAVEDRSEAGHWEGDLIIGKNNRSAAVTLTERVSRQTLVAALPHGYDARHTADAVTAALGQPRHLVRTIT